MDISGISLHVRSDGLMRRINESGFIFWQDLTDISHLANKQECNWTVKGNVYPEVLKDLFNFLFEMHIVSLNLHTVLNNDLIS